MTTANGATITAPMHARIYTSHMPPAPPRDTPRLRHKTSVKRDANTAACATQSSPAHTGDQGCSRDHCSDERCRAAPRITRTWQTGDPAPGAATCTSTLHYDNTHTSRAAQEGSLGPRCIREDSKNTCKQWPMIDHGMHKEINTTAACAALALWHHDESNRARTHRHHATTHIYWQTTMMRTRNSLLTWH